jgi:hypothetical protein
LKASSANPGPFYACYKSHYLNFGLDFGYIPGLNLVGVKPCISFEEALRQQELQAEKERQEQEQS